MMELTPLDVRKKKGDFRRALRGYDPGVVDDFLDLVADRLEALVREIAGHKESVPRLEQQVADYRDREKALTEALVTAQEMREEIRSQSTREVDLLRRQAEQDAQEIRNEAERAREREEESLNALRIKQLQFLASYRAFLEQELADLAAHARGIELQAGPSARASARSGRERPAPPPPTSVPAAGTAADPVPEVDPDRTTGGAKAAAPRAIGAVGTAVTEAAVQPESVTARSTASPALPQTRPSVPAEAGATAVEEEVDAQVGAALEEWGTEFEDIAGEAPDLILSDADVVAEESAMFSGDEPDAGPEPFEPGPEPEPTQQAIDDSSFRADVSAAFGGSGGGHDDLLDLESFDSIRGGPDPALGESIVGPPPVIPPDQLTISPVFLDRAKPDREGGEPGDEGEERADRFSRTTGDG